MGQRSADVARPTLRMGRPRQAAVAAAETVVAGGGHPATIGVVLGTGLGGLADRLTGRWSMPSTETGWLAKSTATGHAGRIVCGTLRGTPIAMLQGRVHGYEGFPPETLTRGIELLAALGVTQVLLTNASGGLRHDMTGGELVVVTDHIDMVRRPWGDALEPDAAGERPPRHGSYDPALADLALAATRQAGVIARKGVYAFLSGPTYETRSEYRMLRRMGADVVGMSTVPEVVAAARMGLDVVVCSVVTNVAKPDALAHVDTDAEDVCRMAATAADGVWAILETLAARAAGRPCVSC
ncbi:MAG: purine-nucleoside phosphorylase [Planctomycetes bacterium]|nr:purine-nucleoside phosphorylase [Planctomycetota bacterium]